MKYPVLLVLLGLLAACGDNTAKQAAPAEQTTEVATEAPAETMTATEAETKDEPAELVEVNEVITGFTAYGDKPSGWRVTVEGKGEETGNKLTIEGEGIEGGVIEATRSAYAKGVEFSGTLGDKKVNLNIRTEECTDYEGHQLQSKATFDFGDTVYEGCAVDEAMEHAPT